MRSDLNGGGPHGSRKGNQSYRLISPDLDPSEVIRKVRPDLLLRGSTVQEHSGNHIAKDHRVAKVENAAGADGAEPTTTKTQKTAL